MNGRRELEQMLRPALDAGWYIQPRRNGHIWIMGPSGQRVTSASTPSCRRGLLNLRAQLRRVGAPL